jgi:hypothetical protein
MGPVYHGLLFSSAGEQEQYGGHRTIFAYSMGDYTCKLGALDTLQASLLKLTRKGRHSKATPQSVKENGIPFVLDA